MVADHLQALGVHHPQVLAAAGGFGEHVTPGRHERQAVGCGDKGLHAVAADGMQASLAVEGEANRRATGDIARRIG
ncbi:hypothetical protein FQZ97_1225880 [compost metagenome]